MNYRIPRIGKLNSISHQGPSQPLFLLLFSPPSAGLEAASGREQRRDAFHTFHALILL